MTVTKEMLEFLGVKSFIINTDGGKDIMCKPVRIKDGRWYMSFTAPAEGTLEKGMEAILRMNRENRLSQGSVRIVESYPPDTVLIEQPLSSDEDIREVVGRLQDYERNDNFERRKESRLKIGKNNSAAFGLSDPVQYAIFGSNELECVIMDASVHGIQVLMEDNRLVRGTSLFKLKVSFVHPKQSVVLLLNKVYSYIREAGENKYIYVSAQILEPVHFVWKERIIRCLADNRNLI